MDQMVRDLDKDGSGTIDFHEFLNVGAQILRKSEQRDFGRSYRKKNPGYVAGSNVTAKSVGTRRKVVNWMPFLIGRVFDV